MSSTITSIADLTTYLIDLDGVVYRGEELIPGAQTFVQWLNERQKKYLFLTNNSFASESQVVDKLQRLGIATDASHVLGAAQAAVKHIAHRSPQAHVYIIGEAPLFDLVKANSLHIANDDPTTADTVLVGLDRSFNFKKLTEAVLAVRRGATFVAINRDPMLPIAGGYVAGTGTMVAAIEAGSGVTPEVIGKPKPTLLQEAMRLLESQPQQTVMIGDNIGVDILAGQTAGTQTLLVFSGNDTSASLAKSTLKPTYVYEDLAAVMNAIRSEYA
jgi:HAD superfamily hydrolase (TIGR01457 family)